MILAKHMNTLVHLAPYTHTFHFQHIIFFLFCHIMTADIGLIAFPSLPYKNIELITLTFHLFGLRPANSQITVTGFLLLTGNHTIIQVMFLGLFWQHVNYVSLIRAVLIFNAFSQSKENGLNYLETTCPGKPEGRSLDTQVLL